MRRRAIAVVAMLAALAVGGQAAARSTSAKPPASAAARPTTYKVVKGDNLSKIARRFDTTVAELARLNGLRANKALQIGVTLKLPEPAAQGDPRLPDKLRRSPERLALMPAFDAAAKRHKTPPDLLKAVAWMESGWQNDKVSSTKAYGIGQLMPDTVAFVNQVLLRGAKLDPKKPVDNINMSARFLNYLLTQLKGDVRAALASYYQGLASFRRQGPLPESVVYVDTILALRARF